MVGLLRRRERLMVWGWKFITKGWEEFLRNVSCNVGHGSSVLFCMIFCVLVCDFTAEGSTSTFFFC